MRQRSMHISPTNTSLPISSSSSSSLWHLRDDSKRNGAPTTNIVSSVTNGDSHINGNVPPPLMTSSIALAITAAVATTTVISSSSPTLIVTRMDMTTDDHTDHVHDNPTKSITRVDRRRIVRHVTREESEAYREYLSIVQQWDDGLISGETQFRRIDRVRCQARARWRLLFEYRYPHCSNCKQLYDPNIPPPYPFTDAPIPRTDRWLVSLFMLCSDIY
jgi:hypothetical protein